jgi:hypothetical protein
VNAVSRAYVNRFLIPVVSLACLCNALSGFGIEGAAIDPLRPLYWTCAEGSCEPATGPGRDGDGRVLLGYIKARPGPGTVPLYWTCAYIIHYQGCGLRRLAAQPRYDDDSLLLGYIHLQQQPGTAALYWSCAQRDAFGECRAPAPDHRGGSAADSLLLGYVHAGPPNRHAD